LRENSTFVHSEEYKELAKMNNKEDAIPLLMKNYQITKRAEVISQALKAIGTSSTIKPLLKIFRTCRQSVFEIDGQLFGKNKGEDKYPAYALCTHPMGIENIQEHCSSDEFERIVVIARHYSVLNKNLENILIGMRTPKAIEVILNELYQIHWSEYKRKESRNKIVMIGEKANSSLLRELDYKIADRSKQTLYRKELLEVLKETGNEQSIPALLSIMEKDSDITDYVLSTIESISKRHPEIMVPNSYVQKPLALKIPSKTNNSYIDSCFQIDYQEFDDPRDWRKIPEANEFIDAERSGKNTNVLLLLLDNIRTKYPDFHFSYSWYIKIYSSVGLDDDVNKILKKGLNLSKRKDTICRNMGMAKWKEDNLPEALKWWIKCLVFQLNRDAYHDYELFLYLSIIANGFSLYSESSTFKRYANINGSGIEVIPETVSKLRFQVSNHGTSSMKEALKILVKEYMND
jgi:hypothetical protein